METETWYVNIQVYLIFWTFVSNHYSPKTTNMCRVSFVDFSNNCSHKTSWSPTRRRLRLLSTAVKSTTFDNLIQTCICVNFWLRYMRCCLYFLWPQTEFRSEARGNPNIRLFILRVLFVLQMEDFFLRIAAPRLLHLCPSWIVWFCASFAFI